MVTSEKHEAAEKVLKKLKERNLILKPEKCEFHMTQMYFIRLLLSTNSIGPSEEKAKAVLCACKPKNASEVRSFLGLTNYNA